MLARLLQIATFALVLMAAAWAIAWWPHSLTTAIAGALMILVGYAVILAAEFLLMQWVNRSDPAPRASFGALARAWWAEVRVAPLVFCWRQPFRSHVIADCTHSDARRGIVFIHGFVCNRGIWIPWLAQLKEQGRVFVAVNLEPVFGSIDDYTARIDEAVRRVQAATGLPPLLVCHSMGGLAARAWMRMAQDDTRVHRVVTIGSPHGGTWLGRFSHVTNGSQMRLSGPWLSQLAQDEPPTRRALFTCWYTNCDNIVFPASTAALPGADNRFVAGLAHVDMAFDPALMRQTLALCD